MNWLLCETLAWQSPHIAKKAIAMIQSVPTQEEQMQYARSIRFLKKADGSTERRLLQLFLKAANYRGGASFAKFVEFIRDDAVASLLIRKNTSRNSCQEAGEESALENLGSVQVSPPKNGRDELAAARSGMHGRDFVNGRTMFVCWLLRLSPISESGGMTGPDLTTAGRLIQHVTC